MKKHTHTVKLTDEQIEIVHTALHLYRSVVESFNLVKRENLVPVEEIDPIEVCRCIFSDILYKG